MVRTLRNAIATGRIAHAFMLTGVRGVGKTTTARIIARALNCVGPDGKGGPTVDPCGVCENCKAITEDRHVDVIEMDAASRTGIDDVRELIEGVRYRPVSARYKVYIIDEVHMLSEKAFNALLEDAGRAAAACEVPVRHHRDPQGAGDGAEPLPALRPASACRRTTLIEHFGKIAAAEKVEISPEALVLLARAADGSVRDGLSHARPGDRPWRRRGRCRAGARHAGPGRPQPGAGPVREDHDAAMRRRSWRRWARCTIPAPIPWSILQDLLELTHWVTRLKVAPEAAAGSADSERAQGLAMAAKLSMASLTRAWTLLLKGLQETLYAPSPLRAAEMALIRLCYAADLPSPSDAIKALQNGAGAAASAGAAAPAPRAARRRRRRRRPALATQPVTSAMAQPAERAGAAAQSQELHRDRGPVRDPARGAPGPPPDAPRARGALRARPDRVPARAAGAARSRARASRDAGPLDRPALDRLGLERRRQADADRAEGDQRRFAAQPGRGRSDGAGHHEDISRRQARCRAAQGRPDVPGGGPRRRRSRSRPPAEEYPADDDIPESEF